MASLKGKLYIASMNLRGEWAKRPENCLLLNVTSAQGKENKNRLDFSPMTPVDGGYKGFWNFESYWQSGKVFEGLDKSKTEKFWKNLKEAKRRYPGSKGKKVLYAVFGGRDRLDYITSRKVVYVPEYYELVKNRDSVKKWKETLEKGKDVVIYDFDGPRDPEGKPLCLEVSLELLKEKINDPRHPFGHGYTVGAILLGISSEEYCS